jgi:hypothetical protein
VPVGLVVQGLGLEVSLSFVIYEEMGVEMGACSGFGDGV